MNKAGAKIKTEVQVVDEKEYIFILRFMVKEHDLEDRTRVKKIVGDSPSLNTNDGDPGVPTPLHLNIIIIEANGERSVLDQELRNLRLRSWSGDSFDRHIMDMKLKPGHYRLSIETISDTPELNGTPVFFIMAYSTRNK